MKKLLIILVLPVCLSAYGQAGPDSPRIKPASSGTNPQRLQYAFAFADSIFQTAAFDFGITEFDFPPDIRDILLRFNNAISANREWFTAYSSHLAPGQPLPYDEKFGITRDQYERIKNMDKVHPALKVVDTQRITVLREGDKVRFSGEGEGRILDYLELDPVKNVLLFAGDTIPFAPGVNTTTAMAYGLYNSYTWRLQRADVSNGLQADQLAARVVEIELGLHQPENKPMLRIFYQDVDHGVSRANLDLAGFILTGGRPPGTEKNPLPEATGR